MINFVNIVTDTNNAQDETILIGESEGYVKSNMLFFKESEIYQHEIECITDRIILMAEAEGDESTFEKIKKWIISVYEYIKKKLQSAQNWLAKKFGVRRDGEPSKTESKNASTVKQKWEELMNKLREAKKRVFKESDSGISSDDISNLKKIIDDISNPDMMAKALEDIKIEDLGDNTVISTHMLNYMEKSTNALLLAYKEPKLQKFLSSLKVMTHIETELQRMIGTNDVLSYIPVNTYFKDGVFPKNMAVIMDKVYKLETNVMSGSAEECDNLASDIVSDLNNILNVKKPLTIDNITKGADVNTASHDYLELKEHIINYPNFSNDIVNRIFSKSYNNFVQFENDILKKVVPPYILNNTYNPKVAITKDNIHTIQANLQKYSKVMQNVGTWIFGALMTGETACRLCLVSSVMSVLIAITNVLLSQV